MTDLRQRYDSDFFNGTSFGALCNDLGKEPMSEGVVFTIKECRERMIRNPNTMKDELGHVIEFWEHHKLLIISNGNSEELFWCIGSETEDFPEKRIRLHLIDGNKKNPYWLRVMLDKIPPASEPFLPNVAAGISSRLLEAGGSAEGFITWAKEQRLLILDRFPASMKSVNPADWCLGMLNDITDYAAVVKGRTEREAAAMAEKAAEDARNQTPAPTEAEMPTREEKPSTDAPPVRACDVEITEDDIPF